MSNTVIFQIELMSKDSSETFLTQKCT